ncbi:MAG: hypothetical protein COA79_09900 [Planctomycetota bacterium]|nr:MAG: hypothetical protein COA79_09900 [Planctomycetota bacterium]
MKNIFKTEDVSVVLARIEKLSSSSQRSWGKMDVAQMLAHCNVVYELVFTDKHPPQKFLMKIILKLLVKKAVINEKPYKKNLQTAPAFKVVDEKEFDEEKSRLVEYIKKTQEFGESYFDNKESHSFGKLKSGEWNNMFYKHLDHHLNQFNC